VLSGAGLRRCVVRGRAWQGLANPEPDFRCGRPRVGHCPRLTFSSISAVPFEGVNIFYSSVLSAVWHVNQALWAILLPCL